jgi:hypothetical protein
MAAIDVTQKTEIYHTLYQLNAGFAEVVIHCRALQQSGALKPKMSRLFQSFAQELQGEMNAEILNPLHSAELADWTRHGKARQQWEKYLKGRERKRQER